MTSLFSDEKEKVDLLCEFYNLQIEPKIPERFDEQVSPKYKEILNERDTARVQCFLKKHAPKVFGGLKEPGTSAEPFPKANPNEILTIKYKDGRRYSADWFETDNFCLFARYYKKICQIIDEQLEHKIHDDSLQWLERLDKELNNLRENHFIPKPKKGVNSSEIQHDGFILTDKVDIKYHTVQTKNHWYGIEIGHIGMAIFDGITAILADQIKIARCELKYCNKIKRQIRSDKKFCDDICRKQEGERPYYEQLAKYTASWLHSELVRTKQTLERKIAESVNRYAHQQEVELKLTKHQVGARFSDSKGDKDAFNHVKPYLEKHDYTYERIDKGKWKSYSFRKLNP